MSVQARRVVAVFTSLSLLAGCATPLTRDGRIGSDDGSDSCRSQLVALDSTGNFFAEDILKGAALGAVGGALLGGAIGQNWRGAAIGAATGAAAGAAGGYLYAQQQRNKDQASLTASIAGDLERENAELDRTQLAFDQLMDCRFRQATAIRAGVANGSIDRAAGQAQMAQLRERTQREIALAETISQSVNKRGAEFDTAVETVAPGATKNVSRDTSFRNAQISRATPLRLRPDAASPEIGNVDARSAVKVRPVSANYALVETASGQRGYVPTESFANRRAIGTAPVTRTAVPGDARSLAASNIARRDNFSESVTQAKTAAASGFELAAS
ncbi:YMGG-like glycine zipper-containing protein [Roseomonas sp. 18066]|uniref:YMGG-like glycine zipper-containing protein n=1 Tax=Roseomonas sp. 18066 TaxID=2681412 RepID=UPI0013593BED|nr:YMGG-like glycine zipper-containing protein [Roseomonas sp. 18066]